MSRLGPWEENWEVVEENYGEGGQGTTHLVERRAGDGETAILKLLKSNKKPQPRIRMYHEAASLRTVKAAGGNVPLVLEHNTDEFDAPPTKLYMVMELAQGRPLNDLVEEFGGLTLEESAEILLSILDTLECGHENDVLHRDIKPANLIVSRERPRVVTIVDYGLSFNRETDEDDVTKTDETFANKFLDLPETNTPGGDHRDPRSDITAACGVLYYCLTAQRPGQLRDGKNLVPHRRPGHGVRERLESDYRMHPLEVLLDAAFSPDLDARPRNVAEVRAAISDVLATSSTTPPSPVELARRASDIMQSGADKKAVLAKLSETTQDMLGRVTGEIRRLANEMASGSIEVSVQRGMDDRMGGLGMGPQATADPLGVKSMDIWVRAKHHEFTRIIRYQFTSEAARCIATRAIGLQSSNQTKADFRDREEVMSFEWRDTPNTETLLRDMNEQINMAIDFCVKKVTGQGVL